MDKSLENNEDQIERSEGSYQKEIVGHYEGSLVPFERKLLYKKWFVFEIEADKKAIFHLDVLHASDKVATKKYVYWIAQSRQNFGTTKYLPFTKLVNNIKIPQKDKKKLHELLNKLNEGTIYGQKFLEGKIPNPKYQNFTLEYTKGVGLNYVSTAPYKGKFTKNETDEELLGELSYIQKELGEGVWLEGINFYPEFKSQGAFIITVGEPQILSFYVEKRHEAEAKVKKGKIITDDTDEVATELLYGEMMDLHLRLHNIFNYTASIEIFHEDKKMGEYTKLIKLEEYYDKENPSNNYNLEIIDELVVNIQWARWSNHKEGDDGENSFQIYTLKLTLTPFKDPKDKKPDTRTRPVLRRNVFFTVNYKGDFSPEEQEFQYVAQIVKVKQPPLITQSYEPCHYKSLKITLDGYEPFTLLEERNDGSLEDNKTPYYEFVLGNEVNSKSVTIDIDVNVSKCEDSDEKHQNNTFDTDGVIPIEYEKGDSLWNKINEQTIFPEVQPYQEERDGRSEQTLKFKLAYPYNSFDERTFLLRYLIKYLLVLPVSRHNPITDAYDVAIGVQSCRYLRTPIFRIYPDVLWVAHVNYDADKILYYNNEEIPLVEGYGDWMSFIAVGAKWLNEQIKPFIEKYALGNNAERKKSWDGFQEMVDEFVEDSVTEVALGFHAKYDNNKLLNYGDIQPFRFSLYCIILYMVILSIAIDVLMVYLTKGKVTPGLAKAARAAKKFKKYKKRMNDFKDAYNLSFDLPKISTNFAIHREQQSFGEITTIFEFVLKADPFIGISHEYEFDPKKLPKGLKELYVFAKVTGEILYDINLRYNTTTGEVKLTKNACEQESGGGRPISDGDILQQKGRLSIELKSTVKYEDQFNLFWELLPVDVKADGKVELHSAAGITLKVGYDNLRGPFLETILFFDGIQGMYYQNIEVDVWDNEWFDSNDKDEEKEISNFGKGSTSAGRMYVFEMFKNEKPNQ